MRWVRMRTAVMCGALLAGVTGCGLVSSGERDEGPITVGTIDTVTALDPAGAYDAASWALYGNVYQSLLTFTPGTSTPVADAASRCEFHGGDLRTYVCELREGLRFTSGREMTARDVKFSFDRISRINSPQGPGQLLETLRSVEAAGRTVTFHLRVPDATFPFKIATGAGSIVDSTRYPADRLREGDAVDGSGPYELKSYQAGTRAELKPNGDYRGGIKRKGEAVTVRYFRDAAAMAQAWKRRSIDVAGRQLPPSVIAQQSPSDSGVKMMESAGATTRSLIFNLRDGSPVKDVAVRRAVAAVVDRVALARDIHLRTVEPLYSLIPQGLSGHTTSFFDAYPEPDPDRARALLRQAGILQPVRFRLAYSQGAATDEEAALLKRQLEATGLFEVTTQHVPWKEFLEGYARGAYDAYCVTWVADFPDADTFTTPLVGKGSALHSGYVSARVEQRIAATQKSYERNRVAADFRAIQKIVAEDVPLVPLWQKKEYTLSSSSISGTQYLTDGTGIWRLWQLGRI
ncbi:ABC transporter substrate-binding protein [Streptomyces sp. ISL-11]|uniref:ABC transporter substrate-binding protein n=1 Tax=Streptomyces sp. ISL-11 TaxID=2819174 RepID=UPI001BEC907B|nr:ABC transporter substrate-binding protein [Streptomyces sp. ISL-11]MBT2384821.1 peptide-binding protein [Streptomyces sp. ISL-11]